MNFGLLDTTIQSIDKFLCVLLDFLHTRTPLNISGSKGSFKASQLLYLLTMLCNRLLQHKINCVNLLLLMLQLCFKIKTYTFNSLINMITRLSQCCIKCLLMLCYTNLRLIDFVCNLLDNLIKIILFNLTPLLLCKRQVIKMLFQIRFRS